MATSGLLAIPDTLDSGGWTQQMQRRRPAQNPNDTGAVLPPDVGELFYTDEDISPQWDQTPDRIARALRRLGAI